ncbi:MAG: cytochrome c [Bacteroidetes bacterium]|nr:cytochrome c [Bacteroidota bacterium]
MIFKTYFSNRITFKALAAAAFILIVLSSCDRDRNNPGYAYFPDMAYSEAYEPYSVNPFFKDGKSMQDPAIGSIPRGHIPYQYPKTYEGQVQAGIDLINPLLKNEANLSRGKDGYEIFCAVCHGEQGKGDGELYTSKKFPVQPTSLVSDRIVNKPEGEIFHIITMGSLSNLMGAHGSQIKVEDRWKIILYMRNNFSEKVN